MKLTKVVNIYPSMPITGVNPPIRSVVKHVTKSVDEIRTCIIARAIVEEILPDGKVVRLNFSNYNKCLDEVNKNECACCDSSKTEEVIANKVEEKTPWQIAYENALKGKDLTTMSRKQRRSAEAAARAAADAAVAEVEPEVVIGVGTIETTEEIVGEEAVTEESFEEKVESVEETETIEEDVEVNEEEVETADVEVLTSDVE